MTTLETIDGRLLRSQRPSGTGFSYGTGFPSYFPPMWSDGERQPNGLTDGLDGHLVSYENIYRSQPVVRTVVDKLSRRIATLPFDAYRKATSDGSREQVEGDALDSLLCKPLPRWSKVHLLAFIAQSLLTHGNALVAKVRGPDREAPPIMLWPLDWSRTSAYGLQGGQIEWWSTTQFEGVERFIAAADTMLFAWPGPFATEIGVSPLEALRVTMRLEDAAQRHQIAAFRNGNRPSLAISLATNPSKELLDMTRANIEALHKGPDNSGKTILLGGNATATPLSLTPIEAALIDQRKLNREEVGMVYDLAGPLMNDLTHGTYSNVAELLKGLYRDVLPPWAALISHTFQSQLLDTEPAWLDRFVDFDFAEKLKGEPRDLAETLRLEVEGGLITRNEARRILNLPPDPDPTADKLTYNANNQAPIDFHRNTEVLTTNAAGTDVNPPATSPTPPPPPAA
jgi:HK97 family phage portal protein